MASEPIPSHEADNRPAASERLFQMMFNQAAVGMAQVDMEGHWIRVNQKLCDIVGYTRSELQNLSFQAITHPDDLLNSEEGMRKLIAGDIDTFAAEKRYIHKAGHSIWINLTTAMERHPETGRPEWCVSVIEEITARKTAERSLREKEEFLESIYQGVEEAIFVVDIGPGDDFTFVGVNPAYDRLARSFGADMEHILGRTMEALKLYFPEEAIAHIRSQYGQCARTGMAMEYEESAVIDNRLTHWVTHLAPLRDPGGKVYRIIGTSLNITTQRETVAKVRETEEHLRQAQKMEAVGRLAGGIAHDFNNLLTAINGYGDLLLDRMAKGSEYDFVKEIRDAGERAASLTHQLLAFSRRQVLTPKDVDLNVVVSEMGNLLKRLIGEDITLETRLAKSLAPILADRGQIEQVILNLALNARDALPKGGRLTIETARIEIRKGSIGLEKPLPTGVYAMLAVSDTGKGMDAETRSRIFEPFFTTKPTGEGTGLGLSTVYGIVTQTGGHIQVYSEPGQGAVFKVYLPLSAGAPHSKKASAKSAKPEAPVPARGGETVLVAEDEETLRKLIAKILTSNGYNVLSANDGHEALLLAKEHKGPISLLLTDVVMGEMGGRELAEQLRITRPEARLIYMSGYTDDTVVRHGILEAKAEFIQKPFSPGGLLARIRQVLDVAAV
jgi:two-component system cell cycle sensor histidine kinase/response regulator CckA